MRKSTMTVGLGLMVLTVMSGCQAAMAASEMKTASNASDDDYTYLGPAMGWPDAEMLAGRPGTGRFAGASWMGWDRGWAPAPDEGKRILLFGDAEKRKAKWSNRSSGIIGIDQDLYPGSPGQPGG